MDGPTVVHLGRQTVEMALLLCAPVLVVTLVIGALVAMLQAVTSIRDTTLGLVVKLAAVAVTLLVCGAWMIETAGGFAVEVFRYMERMGH